MPFDQAVFGMTSYQKRAENSMVMEILKDEHDKEIRKPFDVGTIDEKGQG